MDDNYEIEPGVPMRRYAAKYPICPHCDHVDEECMEWGFVEGEQETSCPSCGEDFEVTVGVTYDFTTRKIEPEDE